MLRQPTIHSTRLRQCPDLAFEVQAERACFRDPASTGAVTSYPVPTPGIAACMVETINPEPAVVVRVTKLELLAPLRRAWVRPPNRSRATAAQGAALSEHRTLVLCDVRFRISFQYELCDHAEASVGVYRARFRRCLKQRAAELALGVPGIKATYGPVTDVPPVPHPAEPLFIMLHSSIAGPDGREHPTWFPADIRSGVLAVPPRGADLSLVCDSAL
jgi:hypothetical protein